MYKFIILLFITCSFVVQQGFAQSQPGIMYKVLVKGAWVEQQLEHPPLYVTGSMGVFRFINQHIKYPAEAVRTGKAGVAVITAEVTEEGKLINEQIERDPGKGMRDAALRAVKLIPDDWIPAGINGAPIRTQVIIPVYFKID